MNLTLTRVDLPAAISATRGFMMRPETCMLGGTTSTRYGLEDSLLTWITTSFYSPSGKQGNSILDLSDFMGHLTTLQVKGSFNSRDYSLPVMNRTNRLESSYTWV